MDRWNVAMEVLDLRAKFGNKAAETDEYQRLVVEFAECFAALHLDTFGFDEVAQYLPSDIKSEEVAEGFAKMGAPTMSKLTKP